MGNQLETEGLKVYVGPVGFRVNLLAVKEEGIGFRVLGRNQKENGIYYHYLRVRKCNREIGSY